MTTTRITKLALAAALAFVMPMTASAMDWGIRTGFYLDESDAFIGGEALMPVRDSFYFNPNIEWVFQDGGDLATLNGDLIYRFELNDELDAWAGVGAALIYKNFEGSDLDAGGNLIFGVGWDLGAWTPYAQAKAVLSNDNQAVAAIGIRF